MGIKNSTLHILNDDNIFNRTTAVGKLERYGTRRRDEVDKNTDDSMIERRVIFLRGATQKG